MSEIPCSMLPEHALHTHFREKQALNNTVAKREVQAAVSLRLLEKPLAFLPLHGI